MNAEVENSSQVFKKCIISHFTMHARISKESHLKLAKVWTEFGVFELGKYRCL